jgi:CHASE3 domain sensor protein
VQGHPQASVSDALKRQSSLKANHRTKVTFAALGAIAALTVVFSFLTYRELQSVADTRRDTFESIIGASNLLSELKDAETGQRGFALTGDEAFLEPYVCATRSWVT